MSVFDWKGIIYSVKSLNGFEEKAVSTVSELEFACQTCSLVFSSQKNKCALFFLMRSLIDRCQIETDSC